MAFKLVVLFAALACANAGYLGAPAAYAPALSYAAAAPVLGSTFHGSLAAPAISYAAPAAIAAPAITSQHSNIIRSFGNLGQISTYSKTVDTPFSSVRKADIRVSNPGLRIAAAAPVAYAAPAISTYHGIAAPAPVLRTAVAAPAVAAYHAPAVAAYHAPAVAAYHAAPALAFSAAPAVSHLTYASAYANYGW